MNRDPEALRRVLQALADAKVQTRHQAAGLGVSDVTLAKWRRRLGVTPAPDPTTATASLPGEEWADLPAYGIRVSSLGRFASLKTGRLLKATPNGRRHYISGRTPEGRKTSVVTTLAMRLTWPDQVQPHPVLQKNWTKEEDTVLRQTGGITEAMSRLPHRSLYAIKSRKKALGMTWARKGWRHHHKVLGGSRPFENRLWAEAEAVVPRWHQPDVRDDLISDIVVLRLEGATDPAAALYKRALRDRNRTFGSFKERSIDAIIPGTDRLRLIDLISTEHERF